ncbi:MAG: hypothetical protein ABIP03_01390 [Aquihabitans sp.]
MLDQQVTSARISSTEPRRRRRTVVAALAATTVAFLSSCGTSGTKVAVPTTAASTTEPVTTTGTVTPRPNKDVCPSADAVAGVVGGPVRKSTSAGFDSSTSGGITLGSESGVEDTMEVLSFSFNGCSYELTEGGQGEVAVTRITSETLDGSALYTAVEKAARDDAESDGFEPLEGVGDRAYRDGKEAVVRTGDAMLFVSFKDANDDDSLEKATTLASAVVPLGLKGDGAGIDCDLLATGVPAAFGTIDDTRMSGGSTGIGDLTIDTEGCQIMFADGSEGDVMVGDPSKWDAWVTATGKSSFTAQFVEVAIGERSGFDDGKMLLVDDGDAPLRITAAGDDLDPGTAELRVALAELVLGR